MNALFRFGLTVRQASSAVGRWLGPGVIWGALGGIGGKASTLVANVLLAYILSPHDFGRYALLQLTLLSTASLFGGGVAVALNRHAALGLGMRPALLIIFGAGVMASFLTVPLLMFVAPEFGPARNMLLFVPLSVLPLGLSISIGSQALLAGSGQVRLAAFFESVRGFSVSVLLLIGAYSFGASGAVFAWGFVETLFGLIQISRYRPAASFSAVKASDILRFAMHGVLGTGSATMSLYVVQVLIARGFGLEAFGAYSLAVRLTNVMLLPSNFVGRNMLGELSKSHAAQEAWQAKRRRFLGVIIALAVSAGVSMLSAIALFMPGTMVEYGAWPMTLVMFGITLVRVGGNFMGLVGLSQGRSGMWLLSDVAGSLTALGLSLVTLPLGSVILFVAASLGGMAIVTGLVRMREFRYWAPVET